MVYDRWLRNYHAPRIKTEKKKHLVRKVSLIFLPIKEREERKKKNRKKTLEPPEQEQLQSTDLPFSSRITLFPIQKTKKFLIFEFPSFLGDLLNTKAKKGQPNTAIVKGFASPSSSSHS